MMKIAIVGGIGSGKSTIADYIASNGFVVVDCDKIYNGIVGKKDYIEEIRYVFPTAVVDDKIDKDTLRDLVFRDSKKLAQLNNLARKRVRDALEEIFAKENDLFVEVSAYVGSELESFFDKVICVSASEEERIDRVMKRNSLDRQTIQRIIERQPPQEILEKLSDWVVVNDDIPNAEKQVDKIIAEIRKKD
ncbi:MAG: dephospho-CoA kinase [Clostridia bacterium]